MTTTIDLARWGSQILAGTSLAPSLLRRWLQPASDTSNRANAVGRPWEIFHAPISSGIGTLIIDAFTKNGMGIPHYSSYFGLTPDLDVGFAILAHDTVVQTPDLNVHVDILAETIGKMSSAAAQEMGKGFAGTYSASGGHAVLTVTDGLGIVVESLVLDGIDVLADVAGKMKLSNAENLDMRIYPTNEVAMKEDRGQMRQFLAVYQDKTALVDAGTPTCITWQGVGELGIQVAKRVTFEVGDNGIATHVWVDTVPDAILLRDA